MKTLNNFTIIYDEDCPMCKLYTGAFVQSKMLHKNGRIPFSKMDNICPISVDKERAKDEIALYNPISQEVIYGLDSLLKIIGNSFPSLEKIARIPFVYWFFKKLYKFISYNRKVIIPAKVSSLKTDCTPSFNTTYRIAFLLFALVLCFTFMPFQYAISMMLSFLILDFILNYSKPISRYYFIEMLGNSATLSIIGLILFSIIGGTIGNQPMYIIPIWLILIFEKIRRINILQFNQNKVQV